MASVRLAGMLQEFAPGSEHMVDAPDLSALLDRLEARFPKLRGKVRDQSGTLRRSVKVFVNGQELPRTWEIGAPLRAGDRVEIINSIQGG